ncbi:MAG: tRNA (guanosine(37)-N1)-methyltransferase TrmD [Gammaproteobacteria bacterium]|nr:tRNA (guanosine(37)-N1)-methyltransferase TrmD [Gammaproteobacteria bacterium]
MKFGVITLFPEMFDALFKFGVVGRAMQKGLVSAHYWNPRDYTQDVHHTVDDRPYGGGPGMVMMAEPLFQAIQDAKKSLGADTKVCYLSPQGVRLTQAKAQTVSESGNLILLAGRYEGVDERLIDMLVDEELSIGDYVLSGGELPAMVLMDAVARLIPGVLHDEQSAVEDSFVNGLLDHPHYTRPEVWQGKTVPAVLLSGNHLEIKKWRLQQALSRTEQRRPDLMPRADEI